MFRPADLKDDDLWSVLTASRDGDLEGVKALTARRPALVRAEYNYTPPLHFAVREGHTELVRYLLDNGADTTYRTYPFGDSLLTMAQDRGHAEIAQLLLEILSRRFPVVEGLSGFLDAARNGDLGRIQSELARDSALARASNDTGETALHQAAIGGHLRVVNALLDAGADPDAVRADGHRPIHCALDGRHKPALRAGALAGVLLARGAAYNIYVAAALGDEFTVREELLRDAALANFEDTSGARPISAAATRNDLAMVKLLLDHGADPSLPEAGAPLGQALWTAVYQQQREMAKLLLEHGANPNTAPESSGSALLHARKDAELTRLLLEYGAEEKTGDVHRLQVLVSDGDRAAVDELLTAQPGLVHDPGICWGEGILSIPANKADRETIELLLRHGARVPEVSKWGRAYYFKHYEIATLLLQHGMNPNHRTWHEVTLLHDMAQEGNLPKARLLLDHGADINAVDDEYRSTPLGMAARWGQREMVELLLERGADPNRSGAPWATPLAWARKKGHTEIAARLLGLAGAQVDGEGGH
jgi:ankyrin repeat protein